MLFISDCAVVVYAPFKTVFTCPKIIEKLYFSSVLEYLSFGIEITFIAVLVWEM
jgi:hypothetical protein